jgi:hypothetical protein
MQVRALAHFDGREPSSYLLDPKVNFMPELPFGARPSGELRSRMRMVPSDLLHTLICCCPARGGQALDDAGDEAG